MTRIGLARVTVAAATALSLAGNVTAQPVSADGLTAEALRDAVRDVERERVVRAVVRAADRYLETWNTRDPMTWAGSLHFPHVRPGVGSFRLTRTPEEYARGVRVSYWRAIATGWHRSQWDSYEVFQVGPTKAHLAGHYSRYNVEGEQLWSPLITYIVTKQGGYTACYYTNAHAIALRENSWRRMGLAQRRLVMVHEWIHS